MKTRNIAANMITILIVAGLALLAGFGWAVDKFHAAGSFEQDLCVEVARGANFASVSEDLLESGAISDARLLRLGARYTKRADRLKAGNFLVPAKASMKEIVDIVTGVGVSSCGAEIVYRIGVVRADVLVSEWDADANDNVELVRFDLFEDERPAGFKRTADQSATKHRLIIAEGVTSWAVHNALSSVDTVTSDATDVPAEGSLMPGRYEFKSGDAMSDIIARMSARMADAVDEAWEKRSADNPLETKEHLGGGTTIATREVLPLTKKETIRPLHPYPKSGTALFEKANHRDQSIGIRSENGHADVHVCSFSLPPVDD